MTIDIIGAGIGGLTTAIALEKKSFNVRIFEQSRELKPVGAGIILANNAMQMFEKLGLRDKIEQKGNPISSLRITNEQLKPISAVSLQYFEHKYGIKNIAIHRGVLQKILVDHIPKESIYLDHELENIKQNDDSLQLSFKNKSIFTSNQLLGADGLHSKVRNLLFDKSTIRNAQQLCWRSVIDFTLPKDYQNELNEAWGKGDRFGFVQIAPNKVYWYALKSFNRNQNEHSIQGLDNYFKDYHPIIKEIIQTTSSEAIHTSVISDLAPIKEWYKQNVCLIGDAAHATTPNMGQGACQSIEDAFVISECLNKFSGEKAFSELQRIRMPKAHKVVKTSWMLGKLAHWKNPLAISLRNQMMKMTPERISRKQSEKLFELERV